MKKNKYLLILLSLMIFMLTACCDNQITQGEVVEKNFTPAHTQVIIVPIAISNGKTVTITPIPYIYHYNDKYTITIEQWDEKENEIKRATYSVSEEIYNVVNMGDEFIYEKDMEPNEPEYTREKQK